MLEPSRPFTPISTREPLRFRTSVRCNGARLDQLEGQLEEADDADDAGDEGGPARASHVSLEVRQPAQRTRAEEAHEANRAFLQSIFSSVDLGVFVVDAESDGEFRFVEVNPAYERLTGRDFEPGGYPVGPRLEANLRKEQLL